MHKLFYGLVIIFMSAAVQADIYLDARLGSVIGGKHSNNDGNLPFYSELGVDYGITDYLAVFTSIGHRSNADRDGVLPDGSSETQDEHVLAGIGFSQKVNQTVSLYTTVSAGRYIRSRTEEGYPLYYEAGIQSEVKGTQIKFGWLQEEQIKGDYSLGSLGIGIRFNLVDF